MPSHQRNKHRLTCPHCQAFMRIRNSVGLTPTFREGLVECTNDMCNFRGKFQLEIAFTVAPSDQPNPTIEIPPTPFLRRQAERKCNPAAHAASCQSTAHDRDTI